MTIRSPLIALWVGGIIVATSPLAIAQSPADLELQVSHSAQLSALEQQGDAAADGRDYATALTYYNQSLEQLQPLGWVRARLLTKRGEIHRRLNNTAAAIADYDAALQLLADDSNHADAATNPAPQTPSREVRQALRGDALNGLGRLYDRLGQFDQAQTHLTLALEAYSQTGDRQTQGFVLNNLGQLAHRQANYAVAIDAYRQAVEIFSQLQQPAYEQVTLSNLGVSQLKLGQYALAQATLNRALHIAQDLDDRNSEGVVLHNLGLSYGLQGDYTPALDYYQQALAIRQEVGDRLGEQRTLNSLGDVYAQLGDYDKALAVLEPALAIARAQANPVDEARILDTLGTTHQQLGHPDRAWGYLNQALNLRRTIGDRQGEAITLQNLGQFFDQRDQVELAILFYKQSVNAIEDIKQDIESLPQDDQASFSQVFADTYRRLANLLLQQERVREAHRVLDLLKVQELDNIFGGVRSTAADTQISLLERESHVWQTSQQRLAQAMAIAIELQELQQIDGLARSETQNQRIAELEQRQSQLMEQFLDFIESQEVQQLLHQLSRTAQRQDVLTELDRFPNLQDNLADIGHAALLYPLILEDRLELVLVTAHGPLIHYPVPVSRPHLVQTIFEFQQALKDPSSQPQPLAQDLYNWLVAPVSDVLEAMDVQTLLYAPDGPLRYIPLSALHDGTGWLAQRYQVNQITAASLMDLNLRPSPAPSVLAGAFSQGRFQVSVLDRILEFSGLPHAGVEVDSLSDVFPTQAFFDLDFSRNVTPLFNDHTIIHLATHAALLVDSPLESFIMFGDGDRLSLSELRSWRGRLRRVDLIVLSACETGTGSTPDANGEEILGFGYLMQDAGARAVIASLWPVSDGGTRELMTTFYTALQQNGMTKAKALQQAQIALITGDPVDADAVRGFVIARPEASAGANAQQLSHPYYWAPFILIGNGL